MYPAVTYHLPERIADEIGDPDRRCPTLEARMDLAIRLSARNIAEGGGPFGAAIFEIESNRGKKPGFFGKNPVSHLPNPGSLRRYVYNPS
ncbi:MAG: hypothetical protein MUQ30_18405 [Anaerolineae bacterium]|nr:hypothetical protein [Anaerolineae bacterium]